MTSKQIILVSASKRRSDILKSCGIKHRIVKSNAKEIHSHDILVSEVVVENARRKVSKVSADLKKKVLIGADTLVRLGSETIGKPKSRSEAKRLLTRFSAKKLDVYTGMYILDTESNKSASGYEKSSISVCKLAPNQINRYFDALKPYDKAGGFSIEGVGSIVFDNIRGSYFNILGLPMGKLAKLFAKIDLNMLDYI